MGCATVGLRAIISALGRHPIWVWSVGTIVIVMMIAGFLMIPQALTVNADDEQDSALEDCLGCHTERLEFHDKLGAGNKACWACHDATDMKMLRLAAGTQLSSSESSELCGQCHQGRYRAWEEGTHGLPGMVAVARCVSCHDPHQPQIALLDITKPHPPPAPPPSPPTVELQVMLGTVLLLTIAVVIAVATRGERP